MKPASAAPANPLATLNAEQRAAVEHGDEPLLVIAGAGTGKTTMLAARVARLVLRGADPQRVMLLSFSRRAAQALAQRAGRMLHAGLGWGPAQPAPVLPWAGTFHAVGARLLREYAGAIGLAPQFGILDRGDAEDLMGWVRQELGLAASARRFPLKGTCLAIASRVVNAQAPLAQVLAAHFPWCREHEAALQRLLQAYLEAKQQQQLLDYDDLLLYWLHMLGEPSIARAQGERFTHLLVDEYQDTNRLQAAILARLKPTGRGLTVVGDDAQAIYGFRAAEVRNILEFPAAFTPPARVIALTRNYRSTEPVLAAANAVIALATQRHEKTLWSDRPGAKPELVAVDDEAAQAAWVAQRVLQRREEGLVLKRQAVLFRASHHSAALELELARRGIPFLKFGGLKFLEAAHVKDLLSVLRWVQNPRHRLAGFRVAQLVPGLGPASARRLLDAIAVADDPVAAMDAFRAPPAATSAWAEWLAAARAIAAAPWPEAAALAWRWYRPQLERLHEDAPQRALDCEQLLRLAAGHGDRERFLAELTLDPPEAVSDEAGEPYRDEDYLILSTMHSAKGQEWAAVTVLNVVDGCIPSDLATGRADEIEEERRLLHVAMTRAKQHLALMVPLRFHVTQQRAFGDRHLYAALSRFVPESLAPLFEVVVAQRDGRDGGLEVDQRPRMDILQSVRGGFQPRGDQG